ncbi:U32 family peptidase [Olsenella sp. YH-ols2217]|uniref:U32 family peptidase n=1 Tax=Kribbibacterium absianum TaxID=3044210 RepID=A0ABT6ZLR5_9ACTN|nr:MULTISPECIES: U32 family peptidase [unclassified Olsenella]MDJ1121984.1 U32 family peptidase [Olsenella sp. YH-ols2216]MDJ1129992.1 U32 family peptidase [Olsenella sp. YH-ols2217]
MRVPEVLAPAGSLTAFKAALAGGADAVYCGLGDFNARRGADNFDEGQLAEACRLAHLAGSRVYLTVNIAIQEGEMPRALALVARAGCAGVDGVIIQDWGLLAEVLRRYPQLEAHVSTQANIHDAVAVRWLGEQGATRVTLSRELSLPEIAVLAAAGAEEGCEVECFAHGALCFCYSGLCQMSALRGPRSANRGLCAQPCRLPHELVDEKGRRVGPAAWERGLCPKDAKSTDHVVELADANVAALKLEGRMKAPEYVYEVTASYREALDAALGRDSGMPPVPSAGSVERRLKRAFNRDFTDAYLLGRSDNEMMSYERSNNRGELIGSVSKAQGKRALVVADAPMGAGDLLEFRPVAEPDQFLTALCPEDVSAGGTVWVDLKRPMAPGTPVRLLRSQAALDRAARATSRDVPRRRLVDVEVLCHVGEPLVVRLTAVATLHGESVSAEAQGPVVEPARTRELTEQDVAEHVGRLGTSPFEARRVTVAMGPGCGMGFSTLHKVRAQAADALERAILAPFEARAASIQPAPGFPAIAQDLATRRQSAGVLEPAPVRGGTAHRAEEAQVRVLVSSPEAAVAATAAGADVVYATVDDLAHAVFPAGMVPVLDEVCRPGDTARQLARVEAGAPCAVGTLGELLQAAEKGALPEVRDCVPVHNPSAVVALESAGARAFWLSPELTVPQVARVAAAASVPVGLTVWGHTRAMTSEHCVLQMADACIHDCERCGLRKRSLFLKNIDGRRLPVRTDSQGRSRIWWSEPLDAVPLLDKLLQAGVSWLGVDATLLDAEGTARETARVAAALAALREGRPLPAAEPGSNLGHLKRAVD